jgi:hypothetical protein
MGIKKPCGNQMPAGRKGGNADIQVGHAAASLRYFYREWRPPRTSP